MRSMGSELEKHVIQSSIQISYAAEDVTTSDAGTSTRSGAL